MKRTLLIVGIFLCALAANAQTIKSITRRITAASIVKDSAGTILPAGTWQKMMTSGDYSLKPERPDQDSTAFLLVRLTAQQKANRQKYLAARDPLSSTVTTKSYTFKLSEKSIVKDSAGHVLPYSIWQPMVNGGGYSIRPETPGDEASTFTLSRMSPEMLQRQQQQRATMPRPKDSNFFTTGEAIKPFKVKDIDGIKVNTEDWAGKTVVLNFWFIGCPPCRREIPELNKLVEKYKDNPNVIFIGIALDQRWDIKDFIKENPFNYHLVADGRSYAQQFSINLYPTNVVVDRQGKVQFHASGFGPGTPYWIDKTISESEGKK